MERTGRKRVGRVLHGNEEENEAVDIKEKGGGKNFLVASNYEDPQTLAAWSPG